MYTRGKVYHKVRGETVFFLLAMSSKVSTEVWKPDLFKGKVVFVTGGAGSICRVQTEALVLLGADAAIVGRNQPKTEAAAGEIAKLRPGAKVILCSNIDVRDVKLIANAVEKTVKELGRIDFVIAGAAGNFLSDFNHLSSNAFKSVVDIDLLGSYNTVKATFEQLRKNKGAVIFVSATLHYYGVPFQVHVGAAKAGVDALSNALAVELGPLGIRCNCIAPGGIDGTEGMLRLLKDRQGFIDRVPLQRMGTTKDIADTTVFLFSPAASYVTGTVLVVDGGSWHLGSSHSGDVYPVLIKQKNSETVTKL
jgi:peroxisomal 2,4-dienoyl-CoA reductase